MAGRDKAAFREKAIALFKAADDNGDGKLSPSELDDILVALGFFFSRDNLQQIHKLADADKSGFLDQEEFIRLITYLLSMDEAFAAVDTDGDGKFNTTELKVALTLMGFNFDDAQLILLYLMADDDSSGFIEKEEFATLVLFLIRIKLLFGIADKDKSGTLELDEFYPLLNLLDLPVPRAKATEAFRKLDSAGRGKLKFEEIVAFIMILKYKS